MNRKIKKPGIVNLLKKLSTHHPTPPSPSKPFDNQTIENKDQRQKVQEYKKLLPPSSDEQVSQVKPSEATSPALSSSESVSTRKKPEIYGLLVAKYKDRDAAIDKSSHLKVRFPTWDIFFKLSDDVYKVYIGPFRGEKSAENFLKNLDKKKEFKEVRLEKITSSDTDKSNE